MDGYRITTLSTYGRRRFQAYLQPLNQQRNKGSKTALAGALVMCLLVGACFGGREALQIARAALAGSDPLLNSLVSSGAITPAFRVALKTDFTDSVNCTDTLYSAFKAIAKDDPDAKRKKLNASVNGARCFKVIVDRQNFAKNEKTRKVSDIVEGILASLVIFYSESGEMRASTRSTVRVVSASDEKELGRKLKAEAEKLKAEMKP